MKHTNNIQNKTPGNDFIMHPTVDVCFAGLMENPIVRRGFCAAILRISPEEIEGTELLPTHLNRRFAIDKLGILDIHVRMSDGTQINMEMQVRYFEFWDERALFYLSKIFSGQLKSGDTYGLLKKCIHVSILDFIHFPDDERCYRTMHLRDDETGELYSNKLELQILELRKLPKELRSGEDIVKWMRFLNGKKKEDFAEMAKTDKYLAEAYKTLQELSADDRKRIEYEEREKALKDYNTQISSAEERGRKAGEKIGEERGRKAGEKIGREIGEAQGREITRKVFKMHIAGKSDDEIASECNIPLEQVQEILA